MAARLLTALLGLPILALAIWSGRAWLTPLVALVASLGIWEFYRLAARTPSRPLLLLGIAWALALVANGSLDGRFTLPIVTGGVVLSLLWLPFCQDRQEALSRWGYAVAGPLYIALPLSHSLMLQGLAQGREWLLTALLTTFANDSAAFLVGKLLGRHRLAPSISPGKTWEGSLGGLAGAMAATIALTSLLHLPPTPGQGALLGLALGVLAQAGDLAESMLKRSAGVKDAGWLLPGHGGVLDRLDSVVFTIPVVYYVVIWFFR